jgi:hypothetical protein
MMTQMNALRTGLMMAAVMMTAALSPATALEIVRDGEPRSAIVLPNTYLPVQMLAAEELQYHVEQATGATLPIVSELRRPRREGLIYVGPTDRSSEVGLSIDDLPPAGYILRLVEGDLFLLGDDNDRRIGSSWQGARNGTLFAVYEFLEHEMQVRWLWPGELGEYIPEHTDLVIEQVDMTGEPRFLHSALRVTDLTGHPDVGRFVDPWMYLDLEDQEVPSSDISDRARE